MMPLSFAETGTPQIIKRIGGNPEIKKHLEDLGFHIGGEISVINTIGGNLIVNVKECRVAVSKELAKRSLWSHLLYRIGIYVRRALLFVGFFDCLLTLLLLAFFLRRFGLVYKEPIHQLVAFLRRGQGPQFLILHSAQLLKGRKNLNALYILLHHLRLRKSSSAALRRARYSVFSKEAEPKASTFTERTNLGSRMGGSFGRSAAGTFR